MHENGQSVHNYYSPYSAIQWIVSGTKREVILDQEQQKVQRLNKRNFHCYEENLHHSLSDCVNRYYAMKLGCSLPWVITTSNISNSVCKGEDKFKEFKNMSMSIFEPDIHEEIEDFGCFIPNCIKRIWTINSDVEENLNATRLLPESQKQMQLRYMFSAKTKVLFRNEVRLYTITNLFAEVGGYLGLLLGESILSYLVMGSHLITMIFFSPRAKKQ